MPNDAGKVIYWDASAILSTLFTDKHSAEAVNWVRKECIHLVSTLAYTETCAVIGRLNREAHMADILITTAFKMLDEGPWRFTKAWPEWETIQSLSNKWSLRGADLWHLATAVSLKGQLPELFLLTFDLRLQEAANGEGLLEGDK
jgi:predicted nucleic acid-binding protein